MILLSLLFILPIIIAFLRGHKNAVAIMLLNIFFGITVIGYFACLVWCFTDNTDPKKRLFKKLKDWHLLVILVLLFITTFAWYNVMFTRMFNSGIVRMIEIQEHLIL